METIKKTSKREPAYHRGKYNISFRKQKTERVQIKVDKEFLARLKQLLETKQIKITKLFYDLVDREYAETFKNKIQ